MALPARLFCDTSFFYACFDHHDVNHEQAKDLSDNAVLPGTFGTSNKWGISFASANRR